MTKTFKRIIITAIMLIALAGAASALVLSGGCSSNAFSATNSASPIESLKNGFINTIIDVSGIKPRVDSELRGRAGDIAEELGISQSLANSAIDSLAIEDWRVVSLPENATEEGTVSVDLEGITANVTTYDDPSVVTVGAYGQSITMAVPKTAQEYLSMLELFGAYL